MFKKIIFIFILIIITFKCLYYYENEISNSLNIQHELLILNDAQNNNIESELLFKVFYIW
jgi:hypothetical protein